MKPYSPYISLLTKLEDETRRADIAEWNENMYRIAFRYLRDHPKADEILPDLYDYIHNVLEARREELRH